MASVHMLGYETVSRACIRLSQMLGCGVKAWCVLVSYVAHSVHAVQQQFLGKAKRKKVPLKSACKL